MKDMGEKTHFFCVSGKKKYFHCDWFHTLLDIIKYCTMLRIAASPLVALVSQKRHSLTVGRAFDLANPS